MKIVFLNFYGGLINRGVETFVHELSLRLTPHHKVLSYQVGAAGNTNYQIRQIPLAVDLLKKSFKAPQKLARRFYLDYWGLKMGDFTRKALRDLPSDTDVVVPLGGGWQSLLTRIWAVQKGRIVIIPGQSGIGWDDRLNLLTHPHVFVALTNFQASWAARNGFGTKIVTIPNGVDTKLYSQISPAKISLPRPIVMCVGALEKDKGIDKTILALSSLSASLLLVSSGGSDEQELKKLLSQKLPGRHLLLSARQDQMPSFYHAADLFTLTPNSAESFGIAYLEALASGLAVVATDDPIRREIIGDAGLFVNPQNISLYSQKLQQALDTDWNDKPQAQAAKFDWNMVAERYLTLLKNLR